MRSVHLAVVVLFLAAAVVFAPQNTQSVTVAFLATSVSAPLAAVVFVAQVGSGLAAGAEVTAGEMVLPRGPRVG